MIELYEGRLGGGKTYSAVVRMVDHFRRGGIVCTNVDLIFPAIKKYCADRFRVVLEDDQLIYLPPESIGLFHRFTPSGTASLPVLVVIDEAHLTFNARDFAQTDKLYRETLTFLTQSRKVSTDIIFIAQSVLNMDKQFMRLVQYIWRFRDLARWKIPGLGIRWPLKQILAVQFDYDGRTILQRSFVPKDTKIFNLYRTDHIVKPFPRLEMAATTRSLQKTTRTQSKMGKITLIIGGLIVGILAVLWLFKSFTAESPGKTFKPPQSESSSSSVNTTKKTSPTNDKEKALYDVYAESFVAWNASDRSLKTHESGWYQLAEMSARGYVVAIADRRVKVLQPDGRDAWVIANRDYVPDLASTPAPVPSPAAPSSNVTIHMAQPLPSTSPDIEKTPTPFPRVKVR